MVLREYFARPGDSISALTLLNVFTDTGHGGDSEAPFDTEEWDELAARFSPIVAKLESEIQAQAQAGRKLSPEEVEMFEEAMYDGSDAYDDELYGELSKIYRQQIKVVQQILKGPKKGGYGFKSQWS